MPPCLAAQETPARIAVTLLAPHLEPTLSSGKTDIDAAFTEALARYPSTLLQDFVQDGSYEPTAIDQHLPSAAQAELAAVLRAPSGDGKTIAGQDFPADALGRMAAGRAVLLPEVLAWDAAYEGEGESAGYRARLKLSLGILDAAKGRLLEPVAVEGFGSDPVSPREAINQACESAARFSLLKVKELRLFRRDAQVAEMIAGEIIIDYGTVSGVLPGDEFEVMDPDAPDGVPVGRLVVRDAQAKLSFARVVWSSRPIRLGDRLVELGHQPIQGGAMVTAMVNLVGPKNAGELRLNAIGSSLRLAFNQGLYLFRPLLDIGLFWMPEASFFEAGTGLPLSVMGGCEMIVRMGVFSLAPNALFGGIFLVPFEADREWAVGGLRAQAGLRLSLRVTDGIECYLEPGWAVVFSGGTFSGLVASGGVIFR